VSRPFESEVRHDFERARHHGFLADLRAILARRARDLIPYHEVRERVSPDAESYRGLQTVRLSQIVGSMDRFQDFNREFFPRQRFTASRWQNVDRAYYQDVMLPPIQLYKVGDVYFVKDGNHRVSVARERGQAFIDAGGSEGHIRAPMDANMLPNELLLQAEYAEFLRHTDLDRLHPEHDIRPSALGRYDEIWGQILAHRDWLSAIRHQPVDIHDAVSDWYAYIYCPIIEVARKEGLTDRFPVYTEADIYLWVMRHRLAIEQELGHDIGPVPAAEAYAETAQPAGPVDRVAGALRGLLALPERIIRHGE
jgi:hypothetical protein